MRVITIRGEKMFLAQKSARKRFGIKNGVVIRDAEEAGELHRDGSIRWLPPAIGDHFLGTALWVGECARNVKH